MQMRFLTFVDELLAKVEGWLIVLLLWIMIAATFIQVSLRSLYTHAHLRWANLLLGHIDWAEPLARILVLWLAFLGASLITREGKHIKIDLLAAVLPRAWSPFREMFLAFLAALLSALLLAASLAFIRMEMAYGGHVLSIVPTWVSQAIIPIGFALMTFRFGLRGLLEFVAIRGRKEL
jgi:TRAP-type C4-dicarboxylate transport system permease small subunit